jgi:hypothetical protein
MTGGFEVWLDALRTSATEWDDQAAELRAARRSLADGSSATAELGSRVAPAAHAFLETWISGLKTHVEHAAAHSQSLSDATLTYQTTDADQAARLAGLMPWGDRALRPGGG